MQKAKSNSLITYLRKFALSKLSNSVCLNNAVNYVFDQVVTGNLDKNGSNNLCISFSLMPYLKKKRKSTSFFCKEHSLKNLKKIQKLSNSKFFICYRKIQPVEEENEDDHHHLKGVKEGSPIFSVYCI